MISSVSLRFGLHGFTSVSKYEKISDSKELGLISSDSLRFDYYGFDSVSRYGKDRKEIFRIEIGFPESGGRRVILYGTNRLNLSQLSS